MDGDPFVLIEDDLNILVIERQPQFHSNDLDILVNGRQTQINNTT